MKKYNYVGWCMAGSLGLSAEMYIGCHSRTMFFVCLRAKTSACYLDND